jgi:hypothetical protein
MRKAVVVLALSLLLVTPTGAGASVPLAAQIVVIVTPPLSWSDVTSGEMPLTEKLALSSAVALLADHEGDTEGALGKRFDTALTGPEGDVRVVSGTLREIDAAVGLAQEGLAEGDVLVVVSSTAGANGRSGHLGIALVNGGGFDASLLTSTSTHRMGLVTADDVVSATASAAGLESADTRATAAADERTSEERLKRLAAMDVSAGVMERIRIPIFNIYTIAMVLLILGGWFVAERYRSAARFPYWSLVLRRAVLFGMIVPVAGTLLHVVDRFPESPQRVVALLLAASGIVWVFSEFAWHRWGTAAAVAFAGITTALTGAALSFSSIFSYSPVAAFRFFGIGNEGAAILVAAAVVGTALELDAVDAPVRIRQLTILGVGALSVFICSAPFLGANVIVAVWGTVTFGALWLAVRGRRPRAVEIAAVVVIVAAALGGAVLLDRALSGGTHIGRAIGQAVGGGLGTILATRFATSVRIFTDSPLPSVVLVIAAAFAFLRIHLRGRFKLVVERYPVFGAAITAGLIGGAVGAVVEDSGVAILALILVYVVGALVMLMLEPDGEVRAR